MNRLRIVVHTTTSPHIPGTNGMFCCFLERPDTPAECTSSCTLFEPIAAAQSLFWFCSYNGCLFCTIDVRRGVLRGRGTIVSFSEASLLWLSSPTPHPTTGREKFKMASTIVGQAKPPDTRVEPSKWARYPASPMAKYTPDPNGFGQHSIEACLGSEVKPLRWQGSQP